MYKPLIGLILGLIYLVGYNLADLKLDNGNYGSKYVRPEKVSKKFDFPNVDIFVELNDQQHGTDQIDFGFGFATYLPPKHLLEALESVAHNRTVEIHQYARDKGDVRFSTALAEFHSVLYNRKIDPLTEVIVTTGAFQALSLIARSYLNPGDEVIMFEPYYMQYPQIVRLAGGVPVPIPLRTKDGSKPRSSADLTFDRQELESKFNSKTKLIWVNNPNNPTGKIFSVEETQIIGELANKHDVIILCDEVAQFYHFEGPQYLRMASIPSVWKRSISVNSGGKTFSNTGWRIGWAVGPKELLWPINVALVSSIVAVSEPMQMAFAIALELENKRMNTPESYYEWTKAEGKKKRDRIVQILTNAGVDITRPEAGYFVMANFSSVVHKLDMKDEPESRPGMKLNTWLYKKKNVLTTPGFLFYSEPNKPSAEYCLRFCILKDDNVFNRLEGVIKELFK